jgi:hypothetical protein
MGSSRLRKPYSDRDRRRFQYGKQRHDQRPRVGYGRRTMRTGRLAAMWMRTGGFAGIWRAMATVDLRSLALFRIAISLILIHDALARWPHLEAFYTDAGTLPAGAPLPTDGGFHNPSLLTPLRSLEAVQVAFCVGLLLYLLLALGLWTRFATVGSFLFLVSILNRNILIRDGGDIVRLSLLTWSLLLPIGARFSLDAWLRARRRPQDPVSGDGDHAHVSVMGLGILAQVSLIYLFAALSKSGVSWRAGAAIHYALNVTEFTTPFGVWLRERPESVLRQLTHATWAVELLALPVLMSPFGQPWFRRFGIVSLSLLHLGISLAMRLGSFEASMMAGLLLFVGKDDWAAFYRFARKGPLTEVSAGPGSSPSSSTWRAKAANGLAALFLVLIAVDGYNRNLASQAGGPPALKRPRFVRAAIEVPQIIQDWRMFAPNPYRINAYWVAKASTRTGAEVDPLTGGAPREWTARSSRYWFKYLRRLDQPRMEPLREYLARYLVSTHNRRAAPQDQITKVSLSLLEQQIPAPGGGPPLAQTRTRALWPPP